MPEPALPLFSLPLEGKPLLRARFLERPNRFLVRCEDTEGGKINAFLPNPGRLHELLLPDAALWLIQDVRPGATRATQFTVLAVERDGRPVMLHTHWCNHVARLLLESGAVPGLEGARLVRQEVAVGRSRFDFLMRDAEGAMYVEVKSCTLFGNGVAMFPDAVTERGRRHLLALADIAETGRARAVVLFIVQTPTAQWFMPDYHTDPAFARTMLDTRDRVRFLALPVRWDTGLRFQPSRHTLAIPWSYIEEESRDRGAYLVVLHLPENRSIAVGGLGTRVFDAGYYTYVGSAMNGLEARMGRHRRKHKRMHWHVDYLRAAADLVDILPIRSSVRLECEMASALQSLARYAVPGFGCTDCSCDAHLFYTPESPLSMPRFHQCLQYKRMCTPSAGA